jgi:uncharacterized protein (TIGR02145 family)
MNAIASPPAGLMVFNTTLSTMCWYNGTAWEAGTNRDHQSCGSVTYGGTTYNSVVIGMQCWMTENLDIGTMITGTQNQTNNAVVEKYCYANLADNCTVYGGLYQWGEMVQYINGTSNTTTWNPAPATAVQGICPAGWHLPTDAEYTAMQEYLGGTYVAGGRLKEEGTAHWLAPNTGATNDTYFTALPGGVRDNSGSFYSINAMAGFRSATEASATGAGFWWIFYMYANITLSANDLKTGGISVRCLKN